VCDDLEILVETLKAISILKSVVILCRYELPTAALMEKMRACGWSVLMDESAETGSEDEDLGDWYSNEDADAIYDFEDDEYSDFDEDNPDNDSGAWGLGAH